MSAGFRIYDLLEKKRISFEIISHPKRFTALETAIAEDVPGSCFAKVVIVQIRRDDVMFVLPANRRLDLLKLHFEFETNDIRIEEEAELPDYFTDCERGAMPPFGTLYQIPCYVDLSLVDQEKIVFNAGSHSESIRMKTKDYLSLANAKVGDYSVLKIRATPS